ncbi:hypothetical protein BDL97_16G007100 [Sphagnum fallax]|nr:hypothetical protein BDL97_16G007100 [Sphagnum fallax]
MILLQKICSSTSISQVPFLVNSIIVFVKQLLLSVKKTLQTICPSANSPCKRSVGVFLFLLLIAKRVSNFPSDDNDNNTTRSRDQHRFLSE